jgi:hypothetical protein
MELGKFGVWVSFDGVEMSVAVEANQRIESLGYSTLWPGSAISLLNSRDLPTCYFAGVAETQL